MDIVVRTPSRYPVENGEPMLIFAASTGSEPTAQIAERQGERGISEAYSRVRKDLYLSFMMSQGKDADQSPWLRAAAAYYKSTWPDQRIQQLPDAVASMDETIVPVPDRDPTSTTTAPSELQVPAKHRPKVEEVRARKEAPVTREAQYAKHWTEFKKWILATDPTTEGAKELSLPTSVVTDLATRLAERDLEYQDPARPRTGGYIFDPKDPHASLFRTHVLQGVSTGSEAYDAIFGTMRSLLDAAAVDEELRSRPSVTRMLDAVTALERGWQNSHPPEQPFDVRPHSGEQTTVPRATIALGSVVIRSN